MEYKVVNIIDNTLVLEDEENKDEWGNPTILQFIMDDPSCFKVGEYVKIMVVKRNLSDS